MADIKGHKMSPGKPCLHLSEGPLGCSDYASRPVEPCARYRCAWLDDPRMPYELRPSRSNLIITKRVAHELGDEGMRRVEYHEVVRAGDVMDGVDEVLMAWANSCNINLEFFVEEH